MVRTVIVKDKTQKKYKYLCVEATEKNFDTEFKPELRSKEMLELGVFEW